VLATFAKEVEFLGLRGVWVSLSPSRRACSAVFGAFEKIKYIFSIASVENLEKSWVAEKHSSDAVCGGTGRWL